MTAKSNLPRRNTAVLWVNDTPDEYLANGKAVPHGFSYDTGRHVIQVSFEALNGTVIRVSFDPETGDYTTQDITEAQR